MVEGGVCPEKFIRDVLPIRSKLVIRAFLWTLDIYLCIVMLFFNYQYLSAGKMGCENIFATG